MGDELLSEDSSSVNVQRALRNACQVLVLPLGYMEKWSVCGHVMSTM